MAQKVFELYFCISNLTIKNHEALNSMWKSSKMEREPYCENTSIKVLLIFLIVTYFHKAMFEECFQHVHCKWL